MLPTRLNYEKDLQKISDRLVQMFRHTEAAIEKATQALVTGDIDLAQDAIKDEQKIDKHERKIQKSCLNLLLMEQPVARDFRELSATLKIITDLERIGDQASDIAQIAIELAEYADRPLSQIPQMATIVVQMVKDAVQAYINRDLILAQSIEPTDDKVDGLFAKTLSEIVTMIKSTPENAEKALKLTLITKYLERIGDHAVNLSEIAQYRVTGKHVRK